MLVLIDYRCRIMLTVCSSKDNKRELSLIKTEIKRRITTRNKQKLNEK